jgi:hypothetical protein
MPRPFAHRLIVSDGKGVANSAGGLWQQHRLAGERTAIFVSAYCLLFKILLLVSLFLN